MIAGLIRWIKRLLYVAIAVFVALIGARIFEAERGPPLGPWHTFVPHELSRAEIDGTDWAGYLSAEDRIFASIRDDVSAKLEPAERTIANRYFEGSPVNPQRMAPNWNRSYMLMPSGEPLGATVLLHGLTDSPYSMRHLAQLYQEHGFVAVAIRMPGHGTVPAGLTTATWEDWLAATRLAVREARGRIKPDKPLHIVGYSNGGALAVKYAVDTLADWELAKPDRLVLMSPMIGVTAFARFAGLAGLPEALLPAFAKTAWLDILPEYNPFKYNSFPVNAARQSFQLTQAVQEDITAQLERGGLDGLPPILTFQSVIDSTVSAPAVVSGLYARLPPNGSELVLFDLNRSANLGGLLRPGSEAMLGRMLPAVPRNFRTTTITNEGAKSGSVDERAVAAGAVDEVVQATGFAFPRGIYSLSHIAIPFPPSDGLYGFEPDDTEKFGIRLGVIEPRGETGALVVSIDALMRLSSNPFYAYLAGRVAEGLPAKGVAGP
jgi:alpha-beta hydrolase superfamily lysophospholipase